MTTADEREGMADLAHRLADTLRPTAAQALEDPAGYPFAVKASLPGTEIPLGLETLRLAANIVTRELWVRVGVRVLADVLVTPGHYSGHTPWITFYRDPLQ